MRVRSGHDGPGGRSNLLVHAGGLASTPGPPVRADRAARVRGGSGADIHGAVLLLDLDLAQARDGASRLPAGALAGQSTAVQLRAGLRGGAVRRVLSE